MLAPRRGLHRLIHAWNPKYSLKARLVLPIVAVTSFLLLANSLIISEWVAKPLQAQPGAIADFQHRLLLLHSLLVMAILGVSGWIADRITRPLQRLSNDISRMQPGNPATVMVPDRRQDELGQLAQALQTLLHTVVQTPPQSDQERQPEWSDQPQATGALPHWERMMHFFVEHTPIAAAVFDREMRYLLVSQRWMTDYKLGDQNLIGRSHYEVFPGIPQRWKEVHQRCLTGAVENCAEDTFLRADGSVEWLRWAVRPWHKEDGSIGGICMFTEVITDRKQTEIALRESEARFRAMFQALPDLFFRIGADGTILEYQTSQLQDLCFPPEVFLGRQMQEVLPPPVNQQLYRAVQQALATDSVVSVEYTLPGQAGGKTFEARIVRLQADQAIFISRNITDRKQAEMALRESEARFQAMFRVFPDLFFRIGANGTILEYQTSQVGDLYVPPAAFLGQRMQDVLPAPVNQQLLAAIQQALTSDSVVSVEYLLPLPAGDTTFEARIVRFQADQVIFISRNITDRKQAELALQTYKDIFQFAEHGLAVSKGGVLEFVNPAFAQMHGYTVAEMAGKPILALFSPQDQPGTIAFMQQLEQAGHLIYESNHVRKDGTVFPILLDITLVRDPQGETLYRIVTALDITDRKHLEQERERLAAILEASPDFVGMADAQGKTIWLNLAAKQLLGYAPDEELSDTMSDYHPAWAYEQLQTQGIPTALEQGNWVGETALRHRDGHEIAVSQLIIAHRSANGQVDYLSTVMQDIRERKQAEEQLRRSEERYRTLVTAFSQIIWTADADGQNAGVSDVWMDLTGQSRAEVAEWGWLDLMHPDDRERAIQAWTRAVATLGSYEEEYRFRSRSGEYRTFAVKGVPLLNPDGSVREWMGTLTDITDRKRAEEAVRLSEERYRSLISATSNSVWVIAPNGDHIDVASSWTDLTGQSTEAILDRNEWAWLEPIHPDDRDRVRQVWSHCLATGELYEIEHRVLTASGEYRMFLVKGVPVRNADGTIREWVGTLTDVTEQKQAEQILRETNEELERRVADRTAELAHTNQQLLSEINERNLAEAALRHSEEQLQAILNNAPAVVYLKDAEGRLLFVNPQCEAVLGLPKEQLLGKAVDDLAPPEIAEPIRANDRQVIATGHCLELEEQVLCGDGRLRTYLSVKFPLFDRNSKVTRICGISTDITDRKQAEAQLRQSSERLSLANAELERASRLKDEFMANMSHELRTPLNAILGLSEALMEEVFGPLTERQLRSLDTIEASGRHLLALINDILDLAKIESGKLELAIDSTIIHDLCQSSLAFVKQQSHQKQIRLHLQIGEGISEGILDHFRLRQALINLLSNAVKFTPEGGEVRLEVSTDPTQQLLQFSVVDTGIGIASENINKLFQPFVQLDSSLSRRYAGTGLGLALVRRIAELHGGSVTLESEVGKGSRFTIAIPWKQTPQRSIAAPNRCPIKELAHLQRVLIIEDSTPAASQLSRYLWEFGISTLVHSTCTGAIAKILQVQPDLVILDILLPDGSGWDILTQLKANPHIQAIPVLIVSGVDARSQATELQAAAYLVKPVSREQLQTALQQIAVSTPAIAPTDSAPSRKPLILLAEDNEANITTTFDYLQVRDYEVIVAKNGREAVKFAKTHHPDLILMDIQMPELDGLAAIQQIRSEPDLSAVPIIALTALAMAGDRERCLEVGANDYLAKPISLKRLLELVTHWTTGRRD
jgi:PAS domain S-box-containing protein